MTKWGPFSGQILGRKYLLGELLGEGGFGIVYAGQHQLLGRRQAIKLLQDHYFSQPKFRERFLREARMAAALDHPHIVHIDDFGIEQQAARAYLVMPFIGGGTLYTVLARQKRPLAIEQIVFYVEQISSALDYAHQHGIVHLDLKPQNLLLHDDRRLVLADFGLAHLLKQAALNGGISLGYGTPYYMAPEHIKGQPELQSDIYSLGVILYQMLVGRLPFGGSTPEEVIAQQLIKTHPPLRILRPELPLTLENVLERALAKQPTQRYHSAGELLAAFKDALARPQNAPARPAMLPTFSPERINVAPVASQPTAILQNPKQPVRTWGMRNWPIIIMLIAIALTSIIITIVGAISYTGGPHNPYSPGTGQIVLNDPLMDNSKGYQWDTGSFNNNTASCTFANHTYQIRYNNSDVTSGTIACEPEKLTFHNFTAEVETTLLRGDGEGISFGGNHVTGEVYQFLLNGDGLYQLQARYANSPDQKLAILSQGKASAFKRGSGQTNILGLVVQDNLIYLYVNHVKIDAVASTTAPSGLIGLLAFTTPGSTTTIAYKNMKVWAS